MSKHDHRQHSQQGNNPAQGGGTAVQPAATAVAPEADPPAAQPTEQPATTAAPATPDAAPAAQPDATEEAKPDEPATTEAVADEQLTKPVMTAAQAKALSFLNDLRADGLVMARKVVGGAMLSSAINTEWEHAYLNFLENTIRYSDVIEQMMEILEGKPARPTKRGGPFGE